MVGARVGQRGLRDGRPAAAVDAAAPSIAAYFRAFSPVPRWDQVPRWPPDAFALTNLVLDHTEGYRFAVAPPGGRRWPPTIDWNDRVLRAARAWRTTAGEPGRPPPDEVQEQWDILTRFRGASMSTVREGSTWPLCEALVTLHAMADEACSGLAAGARDPRHRSFYQRAWAQLDSSGSLSRVSPVRVRIVPKTHFTGRGVTIRSFSRYLALCYEAVDLRWQRTTRTDDRIETPADPREFNIVLVPWPLQVHSTDFHSVGGPLDNMDQRQFGFFEFAPAASLAPARLDRILEAAHRRVPRIDTVILPEGAVSGSEVGPLEDVLGAHRVTSFIAGVRERSRGSRFGENRVHLGLRVKSTWHDLGQAKHHRWCLDEAQIRQYHLTRALDPRKQWWEAIDLPQRQIHLFDMGAGTTAAPLICEDLARLDEVADVLRRIGPSIVIALLLDGPQLGTRWSCRYASVLADEPGSAVLTLTSLGMAARSRPAGSKQSRVVALWNGPTDGLHELELRRGSTALLLTVSVGTKTVWTADGRCHESNTPALALADVRQLAAR